MQASWFQRTDTQLACTSKTLATTHFALCNYYINNTIVHKPYNRRERENIFKTYPVYIKREESSVLTYHCVNVNKNVIEKKKWLHSALIRHNNCESGLQTGNDAHQQEVTLFTRFCRSAQAFSLGLSTCPCAQMGSGSAEGK